MPGNFEKKTFIEIIITVDSTAQDRPMDNMKFMYRGPNYKTVNYLNSMVISEPNRGLTYKTGSNLRYGTVKKFHSKTISTMLFVPSALIFIRLLFGA